MLRRRGHSRSRTFDVPVLKGVCMVNNHFSARGRCMVCIRFVLPLEGQAEHIQNFFNDRHIVVSSLCNTLNISILTTEVNIYLWYLSRASTTAVRPVI